MNISDINSKGQAALQRVDSKRAAQPANGSDLTLRFVTHVLRQEINERRRARLRWAEIAAGLCDAFDIECSDPKERGRQVAQYHREPLSLRAKAQQTGPDRKLVADATAKLPALGVETPGVRGPTVVNPFSLR